jgi:mono/diheme cytochrome c family protein
MTVRTPIESRSRGVPGWALGITAFVFLVGAVYFAGNLSGENPPIVAAPSASGGPNVEQQARAIIAKAIPACTVCHGDDLAGGVTNAPTLHGIGEGPNMDNLQQLAADNPDTWIHLWIDGTGQEVAGIERLGMPAFGDQLTSDEIDTLVEYLKTLQ